MSDRPTVLAAVDLDDHAVGIVRRAAKLAERCEGTLVIAHVVDHRPGYESDQLPLVPAGDVEGHMVRYAHAWLSGLIHSLDLSDAAIAVRPGRPLETVCNLAAALQPVYVVVGRSRWGQLSPFADIPKALERASCDCDLLLIAPSAELTPGGPRRSRKASGRGPLPMTVAVHHLR